VDFFSIWFLPFPRKSDLSFKSFKEYFRPQNYVFQCLLLLLSLSFLLFFILSLSLSFLSLSLSLSFSFFRSLSFILSVSSLSLFFFPLLSPFFSLLSLSLHLSLQRRRKSPSLRAQMEFGKSHFPAFFTCSKSPNPHQILLKLRN